MKGDLLPDSDHVSRYCPPKTIDNGDILATAFMLKSGEEYLSVNWLESLKVSGRDAQLAEVRRCIRLKLGATARLAVLNVGSSREYVRENSLDDHKILFIHEPITTRNAEDASHSGIYNTKSEDDALIAELLTDSIEVHYPARS